MFTKVKPIINAYYAAISELFTRNAFDAIDELTKKCSNKILTLMNEYPSDSKGVEAVE